MPDSPDNAPAESPDQPEAPASPAAGAGPPPIGLPAALREPGCVRQLIYDAVLRGFCVAIPVPFVDEWAIERVRRRAVKRLLLHHDLPTDHELREILLHGAAGKKGCIQGCLLMPLKVIGKLILWPIRHILRVILFVLLLRAIVRQASRQFHEAAAMACALDDPDLRRQLRAQPAVVGDVIHRAVHHSCDVVDDSVIIAIMKHSLGTSRQVIVTAIRAFRGSVRRSRKAGRQAGHTATDDTVSDAATATADTDEQDAARQAEMDALPDALEDDAPGFGAILQSITDAVIIQDDYLHRIQQSVADAIAAERAADDEAAARAVQNMSNGPQD